MQFEFNLSHKIQKIALFNHFVRYEHRKKINEDSFSHPLFEIDYCRFGNFRVIFISRIFYFRIIREVLN